jgi:hypothetical protein
MNRLLRDSQRMEPPRRATAAATVGLICSICCILIVLVLTSCESGNHDSSPGTVGGGGSTTVQTVAMSPAELGDTIGVTWGEAVREVAALLEDRPDPAIVKNQVRELRDSYVTKMVALGQRRESLSDSDKATVDSHTAAALEAAAYESWYLSYVDIYNSYPEDDLDFKLLLASFNVLNQYADFALLKQEAPEEAARLGIE